MPIDQINLLPSLDQRGLRRRYFMRLGTVALVAGMLVLAVHTLLLVPTYLFARSQVRAEQASLDTLTAASQSSEEREVRTRQNALTATITSLNALSGAPTASASLRAVLAVARPGVALTGFSYQAPDPKTGLGTITVSGTASTRDALRSYDSALGALSFVKNADLPISAYAKETQIPFTITLTGAPPS